MSRDLDQPNMSGLEAHPAADLSSWWSGGNRSCLCVLAEVLLSYGALCARHK